MASNNTTPAVKTAATDDYNVDKQKISTMSADAVNYYPTRYDVIEDSIKQFKIAGTDDSEFNVFDQPGHSFFKIVFHFWNGDSDWITPMSIEKKSSTDTTNVYGSHIGYEVGLLAPTWDWYKESESPIYETQRNGLDEYESNINNIQNNQDEVTKLQAALRNGVGSIVKNIDKDEFIASNATDNDMALYNSAYNFLIRNGELNRAEKLKQFIMLLSSISTYSPWYFSEITGLDALLDKGVNVDSEPFKLDKPKSFTIKCLPDALDNRIGTLLDLYRDVVYSYIWKRNVVPSNLRKFDMSIYIFESTIETLHYINGSAGVMNSALNQSSLYNKDSGASSIFPVSYKLLELHDCEIDYNAVKSGYTTVNNTEGFQQTYEIPITVGNVFEHRYNMFMDRTIGDFNLLDMFHNEFTAQNTDTSNSNKNIPGKIKYLPSDSAQKTHQELIDAIWSRIASKSNGVNVFRLADELLTQIRGENSVSISRLLDRTLMGNIYDLSLDRLQQDMNYFATSLKTLSPKQISAAWNTLYNGNFADSSKSSWFGKHFGKVSNAFSLVDKAFISSEKAIEGDSIRLSGYEYQEGVENNNETNITSPTDSIITGYETSGDEGLSKSNTQKVDDSPWSNVTTIQKIK